jgi:sulfide dehydrogenase cytochrome subunit
MKNLYTILAMLPGLLFVAVAQAGPSHSMLGDACAGCHGTRGYSASPMPIIAGLPQDYLRQTMLDYRSGKRPSTIMGRIARGYSEDEIDALAAYFASQEWISPPQEDTLNKKLIKKGKNIHRKGCKTCHKAGGRYQDDKTPRIAGQWREYLEIVFEEYWRSDRRMPHLFMSIAISELDEDEREALAHYYASER